MEVQELNGMMIHQDLAVAVLLAKDLVVVRHSQEYQIHNTVVVEEVQVKQVLAVDQVPFRVMEVMDYTYPNTQV